MLFFIWKRDTNLLIRKLHRKNEVMPFGATQIVILSEEGQTEKDDITYM